VRVRRLGSGDPGDVWLAEDRSLNGAHVVVRTLAPVEAERAQALRMEWGNSARLRHPNLVRLLDLLLPVGEAPLLVSEYVEGRDLVSTLQVEGPAVLPGVAADALRALAVLHEFGLAHGRVEPSRLVLRDRAVLESRLVLLDPELGAVDVGEAAPDRALAYLAPELLEGGSASHRSDLYSLGAALFHAVHGRPPFAPGEHGRQGLIEAIRSGRRSRPRVPDGFPAGLGAWIESLLSPDPGQRPDSAVEALAQLGPACAMSFVVETPAGRAGRAASALPAGREAESRRVFERLTESDGPVLVWLCGDRGCGKTRLLRGLAAEATTRGWSVLSLAALSLPSSAEDPGAWIESLVAAGGGTPLLVLDNVERAGRQLAGVLERLAWTGRKTALRAVAAVRPSQASPRLRTLIAAAGRAPGITRLDLAPLDLPAADRGDGLDRRLAGLSPAARDWTEAVALLDGEATLDRVATLTRADPHTTLRAAIEVANAGLAYLDGDRCAPATQRMVEEFDDARACGRAAELLEGLGDAVTDHLRPAWLWQRAGKTGRAIDSALAAADLARAGGDAIRSARGLGLALRLISRSDARRGDLHRRRALDLAEAQDHAAAARGFGAALRYARDPEARAGLFARQAESLLSVGRRGPAGRAARAALDLAAGSGSERGRSRSELVLGKLAAHRGSVEEARTRLTEAAALAREADDTGTAARALEELARSEATDRPSEADLHLCDAARLYHEAGARRQELFCRLERAALSRRRGNAADAERATEQVARRAEEVGEPALRIGALIELGLALEAQGRYARALAVAREADEQAHALADCRGRDLSLWLSARVLIRCGRAAEALAQVDPALRQAPPRDPLTDDRLHLVRIAARAAAPAPDERRLAEALQRRLESCRRHEEPETLLECLALELERRSRSGGAEPLAPIDAELRLLGRRGGVWAPPAILLRAGLARCAALSSTAHWDAAEQSARRALEQAHEWQQPTLGAEAAVALAAALGQLQRHEEAGRSLDEGRSLLELAAQRIGDEELRESFQERPAFRALHERADSPAERRLAALYAMSRALNSTADADTLLESILDTALQVVSAERGMVLLRSGPEGKFTVRLARNLEHETLRDARTFSERVVAQAGSGRSVLSVDAGNDERLRDLKSISLYGIRSVLCVPLRSRDEIVGAVYLDSRAENTMFTRDDMDFLEAFADHAALALQNARVRRYLERENRELQAAAESRVRFGSMLGDSAAMQGVFELIEKVSGTDLPVLIRGESGTGKELVARAIHFNSPRRKQPLVSENCAAIPESLLQSELFGHVRGAFTGADRDRPGLFELADGGTLLLDEVGDMSQGMQAQLLRVLQDGVIRRVGGERRVPVDVRVLAATHRNLAREVQAGRFREDLLYRLQVLVILLPPLRERGRDFVLLTEYYLQRIAGERGRPVPAIHPEVMTALERYAWPGNVRQLENTLQRLSLLAGEGSITPAVLAADEGLVRMLGEPESPAAPPRSIEQSERRQIAEVLREAKGNRSRAARMLGVSRATIYRKIKQYGL